jgi:hypothetical protein
VAGRQTGRYIEQTELFYNFKNDSFSLLVLSRVSIMTKLDILPNKSVKKMSQKLDPLLLPGLEPR